MNITLAALKAFWVTIAICVALMAMLRVNSLLHKYSPTPHRIEAKQ
jgi:hypothetical protein